MDFATNFEGFRLGINFGRSIQHDLSLEAQEVPSEVPRARGVSPNIGYDRSGGGGGQRAQKARAFISSTRLRFAAGARRPQRPPQAPLRASPKKEKNG